MRGVEPPPPYGDRHLKPARLPVPPHPRRLLKILIAFTCFVKSSLYLSEKFVILLNDLFFSNEKFSAQVKPESKRLIKDSL